MYEKFYKLWRRFPIIRSVLTTWGTTSIGDICCQKLERLKTHQEWNKIRTLRMGTIGLTVTGPMSHVLIFGLERLFPGKSVHAILKKLVLNTLCSPLFIAATFSANILLMGKGVKAAIEKVKKDTLRTWSVSVFYWPFVNLINYTLIHLYYRPVFGSFAGVIWSLYMSNRANKLTTITTTPMTIK